MNVYAFMSTTLSQHVMSTGNDFPNRISVVKLGLQIGLGGITAWGLLCHKQHGIIGLVPMCHVFLRRRFDVWDVNTRTNLKMDAARDRKVSYRKLSSPNFPVVIPLVITVHRYPLESNHTLWITTYERYSQGILLVDYPGTMIPQITYSKYIHSYIDMHYIYVQFYRLQYEKKHHPWN